MSGATSDELDALDDELKKLRIEYEKYFMGVERLEPIKKRDAMRKTLRRLMNDQGGNTMRRFRLQSLQASFITYEQHWNRIVRQIEDGTFKRDKLRAQAMLDAGNPRPRTGESVTAPPTEDSQAYPESIRQLHAAFEQARQELGHTVKPVTIAALHTLVEKQSAAIKAQYHCKNVEFKVAIRDGKAILKAVPK